MVQAPFDAIVTAPGSMGDVNPMLAIARLLKNNGKEVLFACAEHYLPIAKRAGLHCEAMVSREEFQKFLDNPKLWHPRHGLRIILRDALKQYLRPNFDRLAKYVAPGKTIIVHHFLDFSAKIFRELHPENRAITAILAPSLLRSRSDPPRISGYSWERRLPKWMIPFGYQCADFWIDSLAGPPINQLRKELGLPPTKGILNRWCFSPDCIVGLFPEWFAPPLDEQPSQLRLLGFPLADSSDLIDRSIDQTAFDRLNNLDQPPIVVAPGTAHHHTLDYFQKVVHALAPLNIPTILLSPDPNQIPNSLPNHIFTAKYLPFSELLPRSAAIIHHGGVGTTSQALAAGLPQVVVPMAFDQFDNGERVERLGCGTMLTPARFSPNRLAQTTKQLILSPETHSRTRQIASLLQNQQANFNSSLLALFQDPHSQPHEKMFAV